MFAITIQQLQDKVTASLLRQFLLFSYYYYSGKHFSPFSFSFPKLFTYNWQNDHLAGTFLERTIVNIKKIK